MIICIIPARGGSKRLPNKNITLLNGKPLLSYAIDEAFKSGVFDLVCVSSDDGLILEIAREHGAEILRRPARLATDVAQVKHVCRHVLESFSEYDEFAVLLTNNPLRTAQDIRSGYSIFKSRDADFVMSLVSYSHPPQRAVCVDGGYAKPYFGIEYMKQTQLLEPLYRHDGSFIFGRTVVFLRNGEFYGEKVIPYIMDGNRSVDIDGSLELAWAEFLMANTECENRC